MKIVAVAACSVCALVSAQAGPCGRTCLEGMLSAYLTALTAHDPGRLPVATGVKYAENDQVLPLGEGEWQIAGPAGKYRHAFSDPESGQVAAITTITEHGVRAIYVVRLKVEDGKVSEIETQITRDPAGAARYERMGQPEHVWLEPVPPAQRLPRATLITQANKYYSGMERNNPKGDYSFFDKDCNRLEDALQTTNVKTGDAYGHSNDTAFASLTCEAQFQTGFLGFVTKIRERRYLVDEERQAVFAITTFDHNGTVRTLPSVNGKSSPIPAYFDVPRTLHASEAFRLRGDKLYRIEMTLTEVPYGMRSPFHAGPPVNRSGPGTALVAPSPCDRACMVGLVQRVLEAMLTHIHSSLPLAEGVRYSENGQFIAIGDGLWGTAGKIEMPGAGRYAALYADPASGTAAYWGRSNEHGTPGVLALRIKVGGGKISEIEAIDVREESVGPRGGTMTLMRPPLPVEFMPASLGSLDPVFQGKAAGPVPPALMTAYFDGLEKHSSKAVTFLADCTRRDNAVQESLGCAAQMDGSGPSPDGLYPFTTKVRDRRILIADAGRGVVIAVAMIDNPGTGPANSPASQLVPSTYMVPQLIQIENGSIARVEGLVKWMPYGYTSAWSEQKR
ncbi:MAG TPA: hypothetical protein VMB25_13390 [Bryobacteraceae bacterium]|nr:hypothetical protein [Bryobacteraceae bacterium]